MPQFDLDPWVARAGAIDLDAVALADVTNHLVPPDVVPTLTWMQGIESDTVDDTIRKLPGFAGVLLREAWMDRHLGPNGRNGGRNGHGHH